MLDIISAEKYNCAGSYDKLADYAEKFDKYAEKFGQYDKYTDRCNDTMPLFQILESTWMIEGNDHESMR